MPVDIIVDAKSITRMTIELSKVPKDMPKAASQALNRTVDYLATTTSKEVRKAYAISKSDVDETITKMKSSPSNMKAGIKSRGRTLTLYNHFRISPRQPVLGKKYRVKVAIKKGKIQTIQTIQKPFIAKANNSTQIFKRVGSARKPVVVLRSLSVPQMVSNEETYFKIQKLAGEMLEKRVAHEISRRMDQLGKVGGKV